MPIDLNTRLKVNNSKLRANLGLSVAIRDLSNINRKRFHIDSSKEAADKFNSISLDEIKSLLANENVNEFDLNTRVEIAYTLHEANDDMGSVHIDDILDLVIVVNNENFVKTSSGTLVKTSSNIQITVG